VAITHSLRPGVQGRLFVDDADVGPVPYDGNIGIGSHIISVRAEGYQAFEQQVNVQLGEGDVQMEVTLVDSSDVAAAAATTHSALPVPINHPMIDASIGWPYFLELRLGIGVHELVDAGFAIRTFGRLTEFEGRVRFGTQLGDIRQLAAGAQLRFGGGIGPDTNLRQPTYPGRMGNNICDPQRTDRAYAIGTNDPQQACINQDLDPGTGRSIDREASRPCSTSKRSFGESSTSSASWWATPDSCARIHAETTPSPGSASRGRGEWRGESAATSRDATCGLACS
jgi:hypothetical protein